MTFKNWWPNVLAVSAGLALTAAVSAGDDTADLKLRKSSLVGGVGATSEFTHEARAKADADDDIEDVNLRYRLGYSRGYYGTNYYLPRTYAWRSGYYDGFYGYPSFARSYWGGYSGYGSFYRSYYYAAPVYYAAPAYYSAPVVVDPCCMPLASTARYTKPLTIDPAAPQPLPKTAPPTYRYDGTPARPMQEPLNPLPNEPQPKRSKDAGSSSSGGRLVKAESPKKFTYPAYGEHLRSTRENDTLYVKQKK